MLTLRNPYAAIYISECAKTYIVQASEVYNHIAYCLSCINILLIYKIVVQSLIKYIICLYINIVRIISFLLIFFYYN